MSRHSIVPLALALLVSACASRKEQADTSSVLAIDTVKPAASALPAPAGATTEVDSTPAPASKTTAATKTKATGTKSAAKQGETKELGRDSIIRVDTRDKRRQLPPADTTRRP